MAIVLSHISALEYWLSIRSQSRSFVATTRAKSVIAQPPGAQVEGTLGPWWISRPLHVIVSDESLRRHSKEYVCHIWGASLLKGSVLDTQNGFYVCSPELCFLQMASRLSLVELIQLGFELCGIYDLVSDEDDILRCAPLTTVVKLSSFIERVPNAKCRKKALRAVRYIVENSASPKETELVMLLCLPYKLGGYGIKTPLLNHRIDVTKTGKKFTSNDFFEVDLYWPEHRLIGEYDSDKYHKGERKKTKDTSRRNALEAMGYTVVNVTFGLISSREATDEAAHAFAQLTRHQLRYDEVDFVNARSRLRTELFSGKRYGLPVAARQEKPKTT